MRQYKPEEIIFGILPNSSPEINFEIYIVSEDFFNKCGALDPDESLYFDVQNLLMGKTITEWGLREYGLLIENVLCPNQGQSLEDIKHHLKSHGLRFSNKLQVFLEKCKENEKDARQTYNSQI